MSFFPPMLIANNEIGYIARRDPEPGSKYGRWIARELGEPWLAGDSRRFWWCLIFACYVVKAAGGRLPNDTWYYNTDTLIAAARRAGTLVPLAAAQPGDIIIFDWVRGTAPTDHAGLFESQHPGFVTCIEGNTSPGAAGSQSAGGGVYRRTRAIRHVAAVIRPTWPNQ